MAFTYNGDISTSNRDFVRFQVGDTSTADQLLTDGEITGLISEYGNKWAASAAAARGIAAGFARKVRESDGDASVDFQQQYEHYKDLAAELKAQVASGVKPFAGGISKSDKDAQRDDTDRVEPVFTKGMTDHPNANLSGVDLST